MMTGIKLEVVESLEEVFDTKGVALALGRAYFNRDGFFDEESDEYAELVRAYYWLPSNLLAEQEKNRKKKPKPRPRPKPSPY